MKQLRLIPLAMVTAALIGGPGLPTFIPSIGTAFAQGQGEEEVLQMKKRSMNMKKEGVVIEEKQKSKKRMGIVVEEKQKKSKQKSRQKIKKKALK